MSAQSLAENLKNSYISKINAQMTPQVRGDGTQMGKAPEPTRSKYAPPTARMVEGDVDMQARKARSLTSLPIREAQVMPMPKFR